MLADVLYFCAELHKALKFASDISLGDVALLVYEIVHKFSRGLLNVTHHSVCLDSPTSGVRDIKSLGPQKAEFTRQIIRRLCARRSQDRSDTQVETGHV